MDGPTKPCFQSLIWGGVLRYARFGSSISGDSNIRSVRVPLLALLASSHGSKPLPELVMLVLCMSSILQLLLNYLAIGMKICSPSHFS